MIVYGSSIYIHGNTRGWQVCSWDKCFSVEVARTQAQHEIGLMNRSVMAEDKGMLFIFAKTDRYDFRMKNTLIPLDILRIDENGIIVHSATAQPCEADPCKIYDPGILAKYVLEINAGIAAKYGLQEWNRLEFRNIK